MADILSTFQKHINEHFDAQELVTSPSSIHKFGEDIKGANEFIGALQSASVSLKKILKIAKDVSSQNMHQSIADMQEIVENASFMGIELFDTQLDMTLNAKSYTFIIENPLSLYPSIPSCLDYISEVPEELNINVLIAYIEEKLREITEMLDTVSEALNEPMSSKEEHYNFNEFSSSQFAQMLKG